MGCDTAEKSVYFCDTAEACGDTGLLPDSPSRGRHGPPRNEDHAASAAGRFVKEDLPHVFLTEWSEANVRYFLVDCRKKFRGT